MNKPNYRAKAQGQWVYGTLINRNGKLFLDSSETPINPDTLSQATGYKDYSLRDIYEGDILIPADEDILKSEGREVTLLNIAAFARPEEEEGQQIRNWVVITNRFDIVDWESIYTPRGRELARKNSLRSRAEDIFYKRYHEERPETEVFKRILRNNINSDILNGLGEEGRAFRDGLYTLISEVYTAGYDYGQILCHKEQERAEQRACCEKEQAVRQAYSEGYADHKNDNPDRYNK